MTDLTAIIEQTRADMRAFGLTPGAFYRCQKDGEWYMLSERPGFGPADTAFRLSHYSGACQLGEPHYYRSMRGAQIDFERRVELDQEIAS